MIVFAKFYLLRPLNKIGNFQYMQDSESVITQATKGIVGGLAEEMEVKLGRMYEILAKDCPVPKAKRLIRAIGRRDPSPDKFRVRLIQADFAAMFDDILGSGSPLMEVEVSSMHSELFDVMDAKLREMPKAIRLKECREAQVLLNQEISALERDVCPIREFAAKAVVEKRGK